MRIPGWSVIKDYSDIVKTADCFEDYICVGLILITIPWIVMILFCAMFFIFPIAGIGWLACKISKRKGIEKSETP